MGSVRTDAAAQRPAGVPRSVALITVAPGTDFLSWFGHTALLVVDASGHERLYGYGVLHLDADSPSALMHGTLDAFPDSRDAAPLLRRWSDRGRTVVRQELALTAAQRVDVLDRLERDLIPAPRPYRYDLATANCTTKIRDLLDAVTGGALRRAAVGPMGPTFRAAAERYVSSWWVFVLGDLAFNSDFDRPLTPWESSTFPVPLARLVAHATIVDSSGASVHLTDPTIEARGPTGITLANVPFVFLATGIAIAAIAIGLGAVARRGARSARILLGVAIMLFGGCAGLLGSMLVAAWIGSNYHFLKHNENILILNPLLLYAVPLGARFLRGLCGAKRLLVRLLTGSLAASLILAVLKSFLPLAQYDWRIMMVVVPALLGFVVALRHTPDPAPVVHA